MAKQVDFTASVLSNWKLHVTYVNTMRVSYSEVLNIHLISFYCVTMELIGTFVIFNDYLELFDAVKPSYSWVNILLTPTGNFTLYSVGYPSQY